MVWLVTPPPFESFNKFAKFLRALEYSTSSVTKLNFVHKYPTATWMEADHAEAQVNISGFKASRSDRINR